MTWLYFIALPDLLQCGRKVHSVVIDLFVTKSRMPTPTFHMSTLLPLLAEFLCSVPCRCHCVTSGETSSQLSTNGYADTSGVSFLVAQVVHATHTRLLQNWHWVSFRCPSHDLRGKDTQPLWVIPWTLNLKNFATVLLLSSVYQIYSSWDNSISVDCIKKFCQSDTTSWRPAPSWEWFSISIWSARYGSNHRWRQCLRKLYNALLVTALLIFGKSW